MEDDIQQQLAAQQYGAAFELLLERFKDKVFRLAFSMMRNETQAEDVAQETLIAAIESIQRYDSRKGSLWTWVCGIAVNKMREAARIEARSERLAQEASDQASRAVSAVSVPSFENAPPFSLCASVAVIWCILLTESNCTPVSGSRLMGW